MTSFSMNDYEIVQRERWWNYSSGTIMESFPENDDEIILRK